METFDQGKSSRTKHKSRSGNPEFEMSLPLKSREVPGKSDEEGAQDGEEVGIHHVAQEILGGAAESPWWR
jgi:hypothetical protein